SPVMRTRLRMAPRRLPLNRPSANCGSMARRGEVLGGAPASSSPRTAVRRGTGPRLRNVLTEGLPPRARATMLVRDADLSMTGARLHGGETDDRTKPDHWAWHRSGFDFMGNSRPSGGEPRRGAHPAVLPLDRPLRM